MAKKDSLKLTISTEYTANGWKTTVALPNGKTVSKEMVRRDDCTYRGTTKRWWEDEKSIPLEVVDELDNISGIDLCRFLREG